MPLVVSITQQDVYTKLRALIASVVPVSVPIIQGLGNRAAMPPSEPGFVAMTATLLTPHRTPVESWPPAAVAPTTIQIEQGLLIRVQLDCYGATSGDWAAMLAAVLRSEYAVRLLTPVAPLFADNPLQAPLIDSEAEYETRWIVGANLQYNPVISTPQEYAAAAKASLINVDVSYPP